jgi:AraC-like DNA-binding protein
VEIASGCSGIDLVPEGVADIADAVGYESEAAFNRAFKRVFEYAREYRRQSRNCGLTRAPRLPA